MKLPLRNMGRQFTELAEARPTQQRDGHGPAARVTVVLALLSTLAGCGYHQGGETKSSDGYHWSSVYRKDVRTVAVPIFETRSYERGVEFEISKALVQQIEANTPYKVVPRERADTIVEGQIVEVRVNTLSEDRLSAIPQEQIMDITLNFTWKDLRTGRILMSRRGWEQTSTYYPTLGEGRQVARQSAAEKVALAIVHEMQSDW